MVLNAGEDHEEEDGKTHCGCGEHRHKRNMFKLSWNRHHNAHKCGDDGEDDGALRVVGQSVEDLRSSQDMESDKPMKGLVC